jgi:hypothetical protein
MERARRGWLRAGLNEAMGFLCKGRKVLWNLSKFEEWQIYWDFGRYNEKMDDKKFFWTIKMKNGR